jgi:hypothetical protein
VHGLERLEVDHDDLDTILTHIQSRKNEQGR